MKQDRPIMKHVWRIASGLALIEIPAAIWGLGVAQPLSAAPAISPSFPLKVSENHRYLVDQQGKPFFVMGDTPWFVQKLKIEDVRMLMDDRLAKGFNTLFLEVLDDSRIPSQDGYGNVAFQPDTDITQPMEAYWRYAEQVMDEAEKRGLFIIMSELWYGGGSGLWAHHVKPDNAKVYGAFIGRRFARFKNLMWMHAGDRNPDANLRECTRILAREIAAAAPHHLHTVHNSSEFASARFHHEDAWLDVNMGYTYGASYLHILPEYERSNPVRPVILGETGYEDEPNDIERLPDGKKGDLWNPYRIRRNAWWAVLSGAQGYCAGTRLWRWESNWREVMHARSTLEAPNILKLMQALAWWKLAPDAKHEFVTSGFGEWKKADYATAALAVDGSCGVVYLPSARMFSVDLSKLRAAVSAAWFDPSCAALKAVDGSPFENRSGRAFTTPGRNLVGDSDWVFVLQTEALPSAQSKAAHAEDRLGEMVTVPVGKFIMGNNNSAPEERPEHEVYLPTYQIGKYEVTRGEYRRFIEAGGYDDPQYWSVEGWQWKESDVIDYAGMYGVITHTKRPNSQTKRREPEHWAAEQEWIGHGYGHPRFIQTERHPVVGVTYYEAEAYCKWAGGRLPTEAEYEKAARWDFKKRHSYIWPWGDTWDAEKSNNPDDHNIAGGGYRVNQSAPVGSYPEGASPYGCLDLVGNAYEWCADWAKSYPGNPQPFDYTNKYHMVKGGCWDDPRATCSYRGWYLAPSCSGTGPGDSDYIGFRIAR